MFPPVSKFDLPRKAGPSGQAGFTLVEMLVAIVVTSMLGGLLMQSLFFAFRTRVSIDQEMTALVEMQTRQHRFADVLRHCLPGTEKGAPVFEGQEKILSCFSTRPLESRALIRPQGVKWTLRTTEPGKTELLYQDDSMPNTSWVSVAQWPGDASFRYWHVTGQESAQWPPRPTLKQWLPNAVAIVSNRSGQTESMLQWIVKIDATPQPETAPATVFGLPLQ